MLSLPYKRKRLNDINRAFNDDIQDEPERKMLSTMSMSSSATLRDINIASETAKDYTLGRIPDEMLTRAKRRVNVRLSHLIVDARPEFTSEEITTDAIEKLVARRIGTLNAVAASFKNELVITRDTINNIKSVSKLLPVVLPLEEKDWSIVRGEEIAFELSGATFGAQINDLIDFSHVDTEDWEDKRVNALHLSRGMVAVYYAHLGFADIVFRPERRFRNVIFRLRGAKVSFLDGLSIHTRKSAPPGTLVGCDAEDDEVDIAATASSTKHPSLFKASELEKVLRSAVDGDNTGKVSAFFVPGLTSSKHYMELPKQHYFTGKCILTQLKHGALVDTKAAEEDAKEVSAIESSLADAPVKADGSKGLATMAADVDALYAGVNASMQKIRAAGQKANGTMPNSLLEFEKKLLTTSCAIQVDCFVPNGNYMAINAAVAADKVDLSVLSIKRSESDRRLHTVATSNAIGVPPLTIHSSGRFMPEFMPDVDRATISMLLTTTVTRDNAGSDPTVNSARLLAGVLFNNNYNGGDDFVTDLLSMTSEIVAANTAVQQRLAGRLAQEISRRFDMHDDVLFPTREVMANRRAGDRRYEWHRPISLPVRMFMEASHEGDVDEQSLILITELLLPGFIDTVVASGAWAVSGVRSFLETEVAEKFLFRLVDKVSSNVSSGIGKVLLAIHFMAEAATNMGRCSVSPFSRSSPLSFDKDTDFYIEPGLSFSNHILSDIPPALFDDDGSISLSDAIIDVLTKVSNKKRDTLRKDNEERITKEANDAIFTINVPGGLYGTEGVVNISITDPSESKKKGEEDRYGDEEDTDEEEWVYALPRAVTVAYDNDDGFRELLVNNDLKALLEKRAIAKPSRGLSPVVSSAFSNLRGGVDSSSSLTEDNMEHIILSFPGFGDDDMMPTTQNKTSSYKVEDVGSEEVVFWEPLLSIASLRVAAKNKLVTDPRKAMMDNTFNILKDGKIVVNSSSPGFEWLWKRFTRTPRSVVASSPRRPHQQDANRVIKFFVSKFGPRGAVSRRNGAFERLLEGFSQSGRRDDAPKRPVSSSTALGPDKASSGEIKKFLQQDFHAVLTLFLTRMMVVVGKKELPFIRKICNNVAKIMYNSLLLALDPIKNLDELIDKIAVESNSNGIHKDSRGLYQSVYEATGEATGGSGLEQNAAFRAPSGGVGVGGLAALLNRINTKGTHARPTTTSSAAPTKQQQQRDGGPFMDVDARVVDFSSRLIGLVRDGKKIGTGIRQQRFIQQKQHMIPRYVLNDMPKPLPGKEYTSGQTLYVPVNPKEILTDIQWLSVLSDVEYETRTTVHARGFADSASDEIEEDMRKLLSEWKKHAEEGRHSDAVLEEYEKRAADLVELSQIAAANQGFVSGRYTTVSIDRFNLIVLAKSLIDMKFLIRIPNVWARGDWRGAIETAVELAFMSLKENISKGVMVASRVSLFRGAPESLAAAERMLRHTM